MNLRMKETSKMTNIIGLHPHLKFLSEILKEKEVNFIKVKIQLKSQNFYKCLQVQL